MSWEAFIGFVVIVAVLNLIIWLDDRQTRRWIDKHTKEDD
jgi:hypothetical protein